jgi:hypothetical protein
MQKRNPKTTWIKDGEVSAGIFLKGSILVLVDPEDLEKIGVQFWYLMGRYVTTLLPSKKTTSLLLGDPPKGTRLRYKNGNPLDNRRVNLEYSTNWGQVKIP